MRLITINRLTALIKTQKNLLEFVYFTIYFWSIKCSLALVGI